MLLDEVTSAGRWETAVKTLWDEGRIDRDVVVCTGSSAIDLAEGSGGATARAGAAPGAISLVLPQGFAAFARATDASHPAAPRDERRGDRQPGRAGGAERRANPPAEPAAGAGALPALRRTAGGGRRGSGRDERSRARRRRRSSGTRWCGRCSGAAPRSAAAQALLERVTRSLGSKLSWSRLAREMAVPLGAPRRRKADPAHGAEGDVELLAVNYFALVLYFWKQDSGSGDLARDKKVYFGDPLLASVVAERVGLARDPHAEVENALALALYRRYEPTERSAENFAGAGAAARLGDADGAARSTSSAGRGSGSRRSRSPTGRAVDRRKATAPARALPGRPALVASRDELEFGGSANLVPAALAALGAQRLQSGS